MAGNYRLGELQGALLNAQLGRLEEQTRTRDRNGQYLAARLSRIPGLHPQRRTADHAAQLPLVPLPAGGADLRRAAGGGAEGLAGGGNSRLRRVRPAVVSPAALPEQGLRPLSGGRAQDAGLRRGALSEMRDDLRRTGRVAGAEFVSRHAGGHGPHRARVREGLRAPQCSGKGAIMIVGTSHVDITPKAGVELSGFAARVQPSVGVLDPVWQGTYVPIDKVGGM